MEVPASMIFHNQNPDHTTRSIACINSTFSSGEVVVVRGRRYCIRRLTWEDKERQNEYQRLRATIFVEQLGWNIPVDEEGRERDRYDQDSSIVHCVYASELTGHPT